ncbi:MAG: Hsp20/alpha crystallin family protein [Bacteroidia bacterium]|nr:Hsp20/alpha crystallin family protein [Bacteroidia bacterium]
MTLVKNNIHCAPQQRGFRSAFGPGFFRENFMDSAWGNKSNLSVNIAESPAAFRIELAAPGFGKEDFHLSVEEDFLIVKGELKAREGESEFKFSRRDFAPANFERKFRLGETIDQDGIQATYEHGILLITLQKKNQAPEKPAKDIKIS